MASIIKRGQNSYRIIVSCGYRNGQKVTQQKTVKLEEGLTDKQAKKQLDILAMEFEKEIQNGTYLDAGKITFAEFADRWLTDYADINLRPKTVARYRDILKRINQAIGHIKLMKLQPTHLMQFYKNLSECGMRIDYKYTIIPDKKELLSDTQKAATLSGLNYRTIKSILNGNPTNTDSVGKICKALNIHTKDLFVPININKPLSSKTISDHHKLISSILTKAVYWQVITSNPAERVEPPKVVQKESGSYSLEELDIMLDLLDKEPLKYQVMINIALYTGVRLGELAVLEWSDIDFDNKTLNISKQLQYLPDRGVFEVDEAKSRSGNRNIYISDDLITLLQTYYEWQDELRQKMGDKWIEHNKLFTKENGEPIFPSTPSSWFRKFRRKHNLPDIPFHGIRHTHASVLLAENVDITSISKRLGHADINITLRRYGHEVKEKSREAADTMAQVLKRDKNKLDTNDIT